MKSIAILHPGGGMGDLLFSYPVINAFAETYPGIQIFCVAPCGLEDVIEAHPQVKEVYSYTKEPLSAFKLWRWLRNKKVDAVCALWSTSEMAWVSFLAGVPLRIGQAGRALYSFLFTHQVQVRSAQGDTESHWVECLLDYPRASGLAPTNKEICIEVPPTTITATEKLLKQEGINLQSPLAILHCGKGEDVLKRGWPFRTFATIADDLRRAGFSVVLTGSQKEVALVERVMLAMRCKAVSFAGKTDFLTLAALMKLAKVVICPDSGPMHVAAAVGTPVVAIFAMKKDFPARWAPWGVEHAIVRPDTFPCREACTKETCTDFLCYQVISPEDVVLAALRLSHATIAL